MKKIEFGTLEIGEIARKHIQDCLESNYITMGPKVQLFEEQLAKIFNVKHAVAVNSGTSADCVAYLTLYDDGYKPGDYIICPGLAFISMATAIVQAGFRPYFIDIDVETLNINIEQVENAISNSIYNIAAVVGVSTMGKPCDFAQLRTICDKYGKRLILDQCEGHFCLDNFHEAEYFADMTTYSFYPAHAIVAGEMGAVCTNKDDLAYRLKSIRSHGRKPGSLYFEHERLGGNYKPLDIIASIGLEGIELSGKNFAKRTKNVREMRDGLACINDYVWFSEVDDNDVNCPHGFSIVLKKPEYDIRKLQTYLDDCGIQWKRNFGVIPGHAAFNNVRYSPMAWQKYLPNSVYVGNNGVHWGVHQGLTQEDVNYVIQVVSEYFLREQWKN